MSAATATVVVHDGIYDDWETAVNREPYNPPTPSPAMVRLLAAQAVPSMIERELRFEDVDGNRHSIVSTFSMPLPTGNIVRVYNTDYFTPDDGPDAQTAYDMRHFHALTFEDVSRSIVVKHQDIFHNISVLGVEEYGFILAERNDFSAPQMLIMPDERTIAPFMREMENIMLVD